MSTIINDSVLNQTIKEVQTAYQAGGTKQIKVNGLTNTIPYPYPSPTDWRQVWIYFLMTDRFNNPAKEPKSAWNQKYDFRQGGTFKGIEAQLDYISSLSAGAIWISPVLKNSKPEYQYGYPGYATQNFLVIDGRFASDGTEATAEKELVELIEAAHARGLYVVLDIVINHTARVFDYNYQGRIVDSFSDTSIMYGPAGDEPSIQWLNSLGIPNPHWQDTIPPDATLSPDDTVWPADLHQHRDFFRRRGNKLSDTVDPGSFAKGDFGSMRQLVVEYKADTPDQSIIRNQYGTTPVLNILIKIYSNLIAKFDIDAFRIDTVKYVAPAMVETFGNSMREFALSIGKRNFFTFGEIYDDENTIEQFIGRNRTDNAEGFGIDAALDYPLFYQLPSVIKGFTNVANIHSVFNDRKIAEKNLLSSHGEAGKYFVTFVDNHDQNQRFNYPGTPKEQVLAGLAVLFCLPGIPCLYYGTEQGLDGTKTKDGKPDLGTLESVREALWGKPPIAFDTNEFFFQQIKKLGIMRSSEPALQYGRLYFRQVSGNGKDFGQASGAGSILAFSRILYTTEILIVANTNAAQPIESFVLVDADINSSRPEMEIAYSNTGTVGKIAVQIISNANFYEGNQLTGSGNAAALFIKLSPMEIQILKLA